MEPRRMTAEEKDALLKAYHPDYREDGFDTIKIGPNKGEKVPKELGHLLHSNSRLLHHPIDLTKIDYDTDVLIIGGGGAGASAAIEADNAGAKVMIVTKLRIGDANTMMAEGGIQAADKENDSPVRRRPLRCPPGTAAPPCYGSSGRHQVAERARRYVR